MTINEKTITVFNTEKMMCGGCSANVEKVLADIDNVDSVTVDLDAKTVTVEGAIDTGNVAKTITDAGYPTQLAD